MKITNKSDASKPVEGLANTDKSHQTKHATDSLGSDRIGKLLWKFSYPAIIAMLVNAIYNVVDRIYVGQGVDSLGIAAITIVMPAMMVLMALSMLIGMGANALFAIKLGEGRRDLVEKIMGNALVLITVIPAVMIVICLIFIDPIVGDILGASDAVFDYAKTYFQIILYGGIFAAVGPGLTNFIRSDGHPKTSMFSQLLGAIINIILDPIFIFGFGWGIAGAAWATIISQTLSFLFVWAYFNSRFTDLRFRLHNMRPDPKLCVSIITIGFAPFIMQIAISVIGIAQNHVLFIYGGDLAVSSIGVVYSLLVILFMPLNGIAQGAQPILGFNYGAQQYDRVRKTNFWAIISGTIFITCGFILIQIAPRFFISLFSSEPDLLDMGSFCLRISTAAFPFLALQIFVSQYFQSIGKWIQSTILSVSRQVVFYVPLLFLLSMQFGLDGAFWSMPIADVLATILTSFFLFFETKRLKRLQAEVDAQSSTALNPTTSETQLLIE
ncbi:MATE family efflux transporter [Actinomycetota bacterium]|nr:MATE family efflux transporter [Actinomycetota bacterium]